MFVSKNLKFFSHFVLGWIFIQTVVCQTENENEIEYLKTKINILSDRAKQLESNEPINQEKIGNLSVQIAKFEKQSQKDQEITQVQLIRLATLESELNKTILFMNNFCLGGTETTTTHDSSHIVFKDGQPNGTKFAMGCDWDGTDISNAQVRGEECAQKCFATEGCTHFTWTHYNGGTCWMKSGSENARSVGDSSVVCGYISRDLAQNNFDWTVKIKLTGHAGSVESLAISKNGLLVSSSFDKSIKVWNISTGKCLKTINGHALAVYSLAISNEDRIVSGSSDKTIKVWDIESGECLKTLIGHTSTVRSLVISYQGLLVSGSWDKTIKVWNIQTGECSKTLNGHTGSVRALAIGKEGKLLSGSSDKLIKEWDVGSGECLKNLTGHTSAVRSLAISKEGKLISGSDDSKINVWEMGTGKLLKSLNGHTRHVDSLAVSNEDVLISGSTDKSILVWEKGSSSNIDPDIGLVG